MPLVQLAAHTKSNTLYVQLYGHKFKFFWCDGLLLICITVGYNVHSACSTIKYGCNDTKHTCIKTEQDMQLNLNPVNYAGNTF